MPYLDAYTDTLTSGTAGHLLRRATFGPAKSEILELTGKTAAQAVRILIENSSYSTSPPPPVDMRDNLPDSGKPIMSLPFNSANNYWYGQFIKYWWIGLMNQPVGRPSVVEKLSMFWQNHFVTRFTDVEDYRYTYRYLQLVRRNALGNFRTFVREITKDPAMLIFQNGNLNQVGKPNENYAREIQEIFVVGARDFNGNANYTEDDVKAAARVLTGWECRNHLSAASNVIDPVFTPARHDTSNKTFSSHYNSTVITGRSGSNAGEEELNDFISMLLRHPNTAKYICRRLYRFYVNTEISSEIEQNVIVPLASFFSSEGNNYAIEPVLEKLLTSQIFYDSANRGAIVKSPAELVVGTLRYYNQPVPNISEWQPFRKHTEFQCSCMIDMQMNLLDQPTVFGFTPYYQTGYSKNWINASTLAVRSYYANCLIYRWLLIKPNYLLGLDLLSLVTAMQPNFADVAGTPAISSHAVLEGFTSGLFAVEIPQQHKDFIVDHIMMTDQPRSDWTYVWNEYRKNTSNESIRNGVRWRCELLMRYVLRMAEYNVF
jgi:hypothetical protein